MTVRGRRHILDRRLNKKTRFLLAGVVLLLLLGGATFALRNPSGLAVEIEDGPPHVTTPWDQETVPFFLEEDQGQCTFTLEQLQETFGEAVSFTFDNCPSLGNDIDTYLLNSFRMAALVNSRGKESSENQYATFHPHKEGDNVCILLLYDGTTHLMGYFIGLPQEEEDGRWRMDVTLCSYEFSSLYRQQLEEYPRGAPQLFTHFIPLDDLEESGAVWCLRGYETSTALTVQPTDSQCYHLWRVVNSPYLERMLSPVENIFQSTYQDGKWTCFLLYDQDLHLLGYTMWGGET